MFSLRGFLVFLSWTFVLDVNLSHGSEIINGNEVEPHSLPFMALVGSDEPFCGGTLIHPRWILTAAHCAGDELIETAILGAHSIEDEDNECKYRQVQKVIGRFPHPYYDPFTNQNDFMLLQLEDPVKITEWVNVLKLNPCAQDPPHGSVCLVAGWGTTDYEEGMMSDVLMSVNVTVVDREKCNSAEYYDEAIYPNMMCAGSTGDNIADTCQGDSGGPIICNGAQVGVTSFGDGCGKVHKPGVYALLTENQHDWIKMTMKMAQMQ